jgi:hypothetical protein
MLRLPLVLLFVALTVFCWGLYGPVLHEGQADMGNSRLRPFICVGVAYFLVAVAVPWAVRHGVREVGRWTASGIVWSLVAGAVGALGALGIIFAFNLGGHPYYVMPLVFGGAPVVNTLVTMVMSRGIVRPGLLFYTGIVLVALGAAGVFVFNPAGHTPTGANQPSVGWLGLLGVVAFIALTALCWGCYGPVLHRGQERMEGSRLRPFICVGLAYFVVAILIPAMALGRWPESGAWSVSGSIWSLLAGALGAIGALGVILAFTFGGRPVFVMPLVFGGAPVVNTLSSMGRAAWGDDTPGRLTSLFAISLAAVIAGSVLVLVFAPKSRAARHAEDGPEAGEPRAGAGESKPAVEPATSARDTRPERGPTARRATRQTAADDAASSDPDHQGGAGSDEGIGP